MELIPSIGQILLVIVASVVLILVGRSETILRGLGITTDGLHVAQKTFKGQLEVVLNSPVVNNIVLIMFWAAVGLATYLVCWFLYGVYVAAKNEAMIQHEYINSGSMHGPWKKLGLKIASALVLVGLLAVFVPGMALWQLMAGPVFEVVNLGNAFGLATSVLALALQLYLVLVAVQLTFSPWYDEEAFTDSVF